MDAAWAEAIGAALALILMAQAATLTLVLSMYRQVEGVRDRTARLEQRLGVVEGVQGV